MGFSAICFIWKTSCTNRKVDRGWQIYFVLYGKVLYDTGYSRVCTAEKASAAEFQSSPKYVVKSCEPPTTRRRGLRGSRQRPLNIIKYYIRVPHHHVFLYFDAIVILWLWIVIGEHLQYQIISYRTVARVEEGRGMILPWLRTWLCLCRCATSHTYSSATVPYRSSK